MRSLLLLLLVLATVPHPATGASVTLLPTHDNTLFQDADGDTSNGAGPTFFAGRNNQNRIRRALLEFDVAGAIPAGARIDSVTLTLHVSSAPDTVSRQFTLHRVLSAWGEGQSSSAGGSGAPATTGDATWLHRFYPNLFWTSAGGDFDPSVSGRGQASVVGSYALSDSGMAVDVQGWLGQPGVNFGWEILGDETAVRTVRGFDSREADLPADRPQLTIYYTVTTAVTRTTWGRIKGLYR